MTPSPVSSSRRHPQGGGRVFADDAGLLWSASRTRNDDEGAIVFACITDSRQSNRAIAIAEDSRLIDASDDVLRAWLRDAPRIGRLT
jgi:hypothetical protein